MRNNRCGILVLLCLIFLPLLASAQEWQFTDKTLGAVYVNAQRMFELYAKELKEIGAPANKSKLEDLNSQINKHLKSSGYDLTSQIASFLEFEKSGIFIPDGPMWFSIDRGYRPTLTIKAKIKPEQFYNYLEKLLENPTDLAVSKKEKDLVEISFPTPLFKITTQIKPDGISLFTSEKDAAAKLSDKWKEIQASVASKETLIDFQLDFNGVKKLLAGKNQSGRHSVCLGNLMTLKNAIEMCQLDSGNKMEALDAEKLIAERYLVSVPVCSEGGKYSLVPGKDADVMCSVHGSIESPKGVAENYEANVDPRLKPFESFRASLKADSLTLKVQIKDKATLEQWLAIAKQQMLTIKHMAMNQMGHLPDSEKEKAVEIVDSIKCSADGDWLVIVATGFSEKSVVTGFMGFSAAVSTLALPKLKEAREKAKGMACSANRKVLGSAMVMYNLDNTDQLLKILDVDLLVKGGYIKSAPKCSEGGTYSMDENGKVKCSVHGL